MIQPRVYWLQLYHFTQLEEDIMETALCSTANGQTCGWSDVHGHVQVGGNRSGR